MPIVGPLRQLVVILDRVFADLADSIRHGQRASLNGKRADFGEVGDGRGHALKGVAYIGRNQFVVDCVRLKRAGDDCD